MTNIKTQWDERPVWDKGPWRVLHGGELIASDDFTHDVQLQLSGDFATPEQRLLYAKALASRLNGGFA